MNATLRVKQLTTLILALVLFASLAPAQLSLTTNFAGNTGQQGNMFEVKSLVGITITGFDIHFTGTSDFEIWTLNTPGTYLGNETSSTNWTLQGTSLALISAGMNTPTPMGIPFNITIPAGVTQSIYVTAAATGGAATVWYDGGVTQGTIHAANSDLEIYVGNSGGYFSNTIVGRGWNGTIYYQIASTFSDDLAMTAIDAPNDSFGCDSLTATEPVQATFTNYGSNTVLNGSLVQLDLVVDGGAPLTEFAVLPADLLQGQSYTHSFAATADLSAIGPHTVAVTAVHPGDMDPANDTKSKIVNNGNLNSVSTFPWTENFDASASQNSTVPPSGWMQDTTDATGADSDWYMHTGSTGSTNTGPQNDHSSGGGYYAYVEDSSGSHPQVNLLTPCLDLSTLSSPLCSFWMHSFNATSPSTTNENFLSVDIVAYPGGTVTMDALGPIGHQATATTWPGSTWTQQSINLAPFAGQLIQLRFRGRSDGGSFTHDIAIDDVSVFEPLPTPGQAPRAGIGVMDIANSLNGNLGGVSSGLGGPYYASISQGATFAFHFEGEPGQPIAVLYGPLNPVSATYPGGIGQFDIGGPGVDAQGIPLNLAIFANAIAWAQAGFPGFPGDALFFTDGTGQLDISFTMPNFGIPSGQVLTTFQSAITSTAAPFIYITNCVELTIS